MGAAALGTLMLLLMQGMTTYTYDDYYYSLFFKEGVSGFLTGNIQHYLVRNGRVLVHLAAELLLRFGSWGYALGNTAVMVGCFALGLRYLDGDRKQDRLLMLAGALVLVLLGNIRVFRSWFLCPADAANYTLPLVAIFCLLLALNRGKAVWAMLLALVCGATTELCSMMAFAAVALELLRERFRKGRWDRMRILCLGCILLGLSTILLSPATRDRVAGEFSLARVGVGFLRYANSIAAPGSSLLLLTVTAPVLALGLPRGCKLTWAAVPMTALLASGYVLPRSTRFTAAVFGVYCLYVLVLAGAMILTDRERRCGYVLLSGLGSAAIMTLSASGSVRVTIPFVICIIVTAAHLLPELKNLNLRGILAAALSVVLLLQVPTVVGIARNYRVLLSNNQTLAQTPATYTDYDPRYCTQQVFMSRDHQRVHLQYLELEEAEIRYNYSFGPEITLGDRTVSTLRYRDKVYIPLRAAVEARGGTVDLISDSFLEIWVDDRCWLYQAPMLHGPEGSRDVNWDFVSVENQYYIAEDLLAVLGIAPEGQ